MVTRYQLCDIHRTKCTHERIQDRRTYPSLRSDVSGLRAYISETSGISDFWISQGSSISFSKRVHVAGTRCSNNTLSRYQRTQGSRNKEESTLFQRQPCASTKDKRSHTGSYSKMSYSGHGLSSKVLLDDGRFPKSPLLPIMIQKAAVPRSLARRRIWPSSRTPGRQSRRKAQTARLQYHL